jgi:hypothetical protein
MTAEERQTVVRRVADEAARMLAAGWQGTTVVVPELGETWTISRETS